jgi:acyl carrier protein
MKHYKEIIVVISEVEKKVKEAISKQMCFDINEIKNDMHLIKDLGADSLALMELIMQLEDMFDINISDKDFIEVHTVQDSILKVQELIT